MKRHFFSLVTVLALALTMGCQDKEEAPSMGQQIKGNWVLENQRSERFSPEGELVDFKEEAGELALYRFEEGNLVVEVHATETATTYKYLYYRSYEKDYLDIDSGQEVQKVQITALSPDRMTLVEERTDHHTFWENGQEYHVAKYVRTFQLRRDTAVRD